MHDSMESFEFEAIRKMFSLEGKLSVVTGASSGLGEAIAVSFAACGSDVALVDLNGAGLIPVKERILAMGRRCRSYVADVSSWDSVQSAADSIREELGVPHILVHCAGMNIRKEVLELSAEEYGRVIGTDLNGTFFCDKAFGGMMVEAGRGSIVNLSSVNAVSAIARNCAYGISKAGVAQMTRVMALEWAKKGVRINALCPGFHKTPLVRQIMNDKEWYAELLSRTPMDRFAEVYEIIGPALFLASDASSYTTGSCLYSDGGWTAI